MQSLMDSLRNLVQPEQPHVPASPTGTHQPDATQAASSPPVVVDLTVDHQEPDSSKFQTLMKWIPAPIPESVNKELVLFSRPPLPIPPRGSNESTSSDSMQGSEAVSDSGDSETTQSVSPPTRATLLQEGYVSAGRPAGSPLNRPIEVSDGEEGTPLIMKRRVMPLGSGGPASRVRSARSQSSGPHAIVDATIFHTFAAQTLTDVELFDVEVVREFWAHLPSVKSEDVSVRVWLRGHEYEFSLARVNALFRLPDVDDFAFLEQAARVTNAQLAGYLSGNLHGSLAALATTSYFTEDMRSLVRICGTNWSPTMNLFYKNRNRLMLLYRLGNGIPFNFRKLVVDHVLSVARSSVAKLYLPFPSLICRLLTAQRPVERIQDDVLPHHAPAEDDGPKDVTEQATVSTSPSITKMQQAIRQAIQIMEVALTGM
ncbi:hypothetical protein AALP_AA8G306700 [Arabis alpina]|uniref:Putative plant transposon protein domain-containing protein n=1 Tax=Arabis alpina TaxID=50452 RepID=A0A087GAI5_ARAAL|nr:hypothetical protein AALP_AA8G306700 [Arabis alpina]